MFRRAMKRAMQNAMRLGAQGIKIMSAGRLNGIEIARTEWYREGRRAAAHPARRHRLRVRRGEDHLRGDRHQGVGLQGRSARQARAAGHRAVGGNPGRDARSAACAAAPRRDRAPGPKARRRRTCGRARRAAVRRRPKALPRPKAGEAASPEAVEAPKPEPKKPPVKRVVKKTTGGPGDASTSKDQVPQAAEGPQLRRRDARQQGVVRRVRPEGDHPRPAHRAPDRGGAPRDDPPRQARRPDLDPDLPGQADFQKPAEVRMGNGKGNPEYFVAEIQPGKVLYEMDGVDETLAREAFALAAAKLPIRTTFVQRQRWGDAMKTSELRGQGRGAAARRSCRTCSRRSSACACRRPPSS